MRIASRAAVLAVGLTLAALIATAGRASLLDDVVEAVVHLKTSINPDGALVESLGHEREGSAIVIDDSGLVLTIGYLMVEAQSAEITTNDGRTFPATIVGYDYETGFGLLRMLKPPKIKPLALGKSADLKEQDPALVVSDGGAAMVLPVHVVSRREFTGRWEYLIENAIYTSPAHPAWSGAALINRDGKLVGVGSLNVGDASGEGEDSPGNVFVPTDLLAPIMADLLAKGRVAGPGRPWLGLSAQAAHGRLFVGRVTPGSPAAKAGLRHGDVIIGVDGERTRTLSEFLRRVWATGAAGVTVQLDVLSDGEPRRVDVKSVDRLDTLKLQSTF